MASDMDKPQGFSVIGRAETLDILSEKPVGVIWGLGEAGQRALSEAGIRTIHDLRRWDRDALIRRFGSQGMRLYQLARGEDSRTVSRDRAVKSISNETTFSEDIAEIDILDGHIWRLAEKLSDRAKAKRLAGRTVTLKLKRDDFRLMTRRTTLPDGTQTADRIYRTARGLYDRMEHPRPYRLVGVGISDLMPAEAADREGDLLDPGAGVRVAAERATDRIRARFGPEAILKGRALR
jgi:DNA polymerase-4